MSEPFTPDELVILAEACGREHVIANSDEWGVFVDCSLNGRVRWQPHLDAAQRDEVVEAMARRGLVVEVEFSSDDKGPCAICTIRQTLDENGDEFDPHKVWQMPDTMPISRLTPGEAVCRAALKALEKSNGT